MNAETYKLNNCVEKIFKGINVKSIPNGEVKYYELNMKHFNGNSIKIDLTDVKSSDKVSQIEKRKLQKGDIIIPARMELGDKVAIFDIDTPLPCIINHQYWIIRPDTTMINNYYLLSFLLNSEIQSIINTDDRNIKPIIAKGGKEFHYTEKLEDFIKSVNGNIEAIEEYLNKINENAELVTITKAPEGTTRPDITLPDGTMLEVKIKRFEFTSIHEDSLKELRITRPPLDEQKKMEDIFKSLQYINEFKNTTKQLQDNINATVYNSTDTNTLIQELGNIESVMKSLQDKYTHIEAIIKK